MGQISDAWATETVMQYWSPIEHYLLPEAAQNWAALVRQEEFTVWERRLWKHAKSRNSRSRQYNGIPTMAIGAQGQVQVHVGLLKEAPYMGHKGGNHIFRMVQDPSMDGFSKCLKYEGQAPEDSGEQLRRLRIILLPDILDMVICLLAFTPCPTRGQTRQMVPQELQVIRDKQGCVNQDDIDLLLNIWQLKFRDDVDRRETRMRTSDLIPGSSTRPAMRKLAYAAWLIYTLRHSNMLALAVSWDSLAQLIELASDSPFKKLLQPHHRNMEEEGLRMLYGEEGSRRRVLVYRSQEGAAYAAALADERRGWKKDAAHGDAFRWAAQVPARAPPTPVDGASQSALVTPRYFGDPLESSLFHRFYRKLSNPDASSSQDPEDSAIDVDWAFTPDLAIILFNLAIID